MDRRRFLLTSLAGALAAPLAAEAQPAAGILYRIGVLTELRSDATFDDRVPETRKGDSRDVHPRRDRLTLRGEPR